MTSAVTPMTAVSAYAQWLSRTPGPVAKDLETFVGLLRKWQPAQNLVSRETLDDVWTRHVADSLQVAKVIPAGAKRFVDIGSGGGFPAIPLAIASKGADRTFLLLEPNQRKASFLKTVIRELALPVTVSAERAENDSRETFDVVTARAVAPLPKLLSLVAPMFGPQTFGIFHKGREHVEEIAQAAHAFDFDVVIHNSDTDPQGVLLEITDLRAAAKV